MIQQKDWFEERLKRLEEIVRELNMAINNYIDHVQAMDASLTDAEEIGDMNEETVNHYIGRLKEITCGLPGPSELQELLEKHHK